MGNRLESVFKELITITDQVTQVGQKRKDMRRDDEYGVRLMAL